MDRVAPPSPTARQGSALRHASPAVQHCQPVVETACPRHLPRWPADCRQLQARTSAGSRRATLILGLASSDAPRPPAPPRPTVAPASFVMLGAVLTAAWPAAQNPRLGRTYRGASCQFLSEECGNNLFCINGGTCVSGGCDCPSGFRWGSLHGSTTSLRSRGAALARSPEP